MEHLKLTTLMAIKILLKYMMCFWNLQFQLFVIMKIVLLQ